MWLRLFRQPRTIILFPFPLKSASYMNLHSSHTKLMFCCSLFADWFEINNILFLAYAIDPALSLSTVCQMLNLQCYI